MVVDIIEHNMDMDRIFDQRLYTVEGLASRRTESPILVVKEI